MNTHSLDLELSSSQYASRADTASLSITGDLTAECWIKLEQLPSTAGTDMTLVAKWETDSNLRSYILFFDQATDKLSIAWSSDGTNVSQAITDAAFAVAGDVGKWVHIACSLDVSGKAAVMYKDTVSVGVGAGSGTQTAIHNNASKFAIGTNSIVAGATSFYDGLIDEVRMWNDIRSSGEVSANWKKELVGNEAGLVGYWKLNDDYTDSQTSGNNDLAATGSPVFTRDVPFPIAVKGGYTYFM